MTYTAIGRALLCLILGVVVVATVVAFVPGPLQVLAALVVLPVESILLAIATSPRRRLSDRAASPAS